MTTSFPVYAPMPENREDNHTRPNVCPGADHRYSLAAPGQTFGLDELRLGFVAPTLGSKSQACPLRALRGEALDALGSKPFHSSASPSPMTRSLPATASRVLCDIADIQQRSCKLPLLDRKILRFHFSLFPLVLHRAFLQDAQLVRSKQDENGILGRYGACPKSSKFCVYI